MPDGAATEAPRAAVEPGDDAALLHPLQVAPDGDDGRARDVGQFLHMREAVAIEVMLNLVDPVRLHRSPPQRPAS